MSIHAVIQERRKSLGLTQEQVADYLGVTTPAVNKWEKGTTCPDIMLLAPLARLLKIDLNTLFGFYEDITQQELIYFCKKIDHAIETEGFSAGFKLAQEKICEYPNSEKLLHNLALQFHGRLLTAGLREDEIKKYLDIILQWHKRLTNSEEAAIRNNAYYMLASQAAADQHYHQAQDYLDQIPNRNDTPDKRMLQAAIYLMQNQGEEAAKLMQTALIAAVNDVQMILYKLVDAEIAVGDEAAASYVAERVTRLAEDFDLSNYNTLVVPFQIAVANKDAEQTIVLLRKMLEALAIAWKLDASPLYRRVKVGGDGTEMSKVIVPLLESVKQAPEYEFLRTSPEYEKLLKEYDREQKLS